MGPQGSVNALTSVMCFKPQTSKKMLNGSMDLLSNFVQEQLLSASNHRHLKK